MRARAGGTREAGASPEAAVLVVEDDSDIRGLLCDLLERRGLRALGAPDGRAGLRVFHDHRPDLVVLDISIPELDGWATLERIRDVSDVPVLVLTARSAEAEKIRAFQLGADDYVVKPFGHRELLARVAALLRRSVAGRVGGRYEDDYLSIDHATREVRVSGRPIRLTPQEYRLLVALASHAGQVLSREQLLELAWGDPYGLSRNSVRLYIGYLRRKLGPDLRLETVRGFGYRYRPRRRRAA